jgi:hypothetical protein
MEGVRKYFGGIFSATLKSILVGSIILVAISVAIIPATTITDALMSKLNDKVFLVLLLDMITLLMVFFALMFTRAYISFWYPAIYKCKGNAFSVGKKSVDRFFGDVVKKFIMFDIVFIVCQLILMFMYNLLNGVMIASYIPVLLNWVFKTLFVVAFITYVFRAFRYYAKGEKVGAREQKPKSRYDNVPQYSNEGRRNQYRNVPPQRVPNEGRRRINRNVQYNNEEDDVQYGKKLSQEYLNKYKEFDQDKYNDTYNNKYNDKYDGKR